MSARTDSGPAALQQRIHAARLAESPASEAQLLPFQAGGARWSIPSRLVQKMLLVDGVTQVAGYVGQPPAVVGVVANGSDVLTVVDAGLAVAGSRSMVTIRSRLLLIAGHGLDGVALLVDRAFDRVAQVDSEAAGRPFDLNALAAHFRKD